MNEKISTSIGESKRKVVHWAPTNNEWCCGGCTIIYKVMGNSGSGASAQMFIVSATEVQQGLVDLVEEHSLILDDGARHGNA